MNPISTFRMSERALIAVDSCVRYWPIWLILCQTGHSFTQIVDVGTHTERIHDYAEMSRLLRWLNDRIFDLYLKIPFRFFWHQERISATHVHQQRFDIPHCWKTILAMENEVNLGIICVTTLIACEKQWSVEKRENQLACKLNPVAHHSRQLGDQK